jgi:ADP-ribosyl-[dinitrogen reductase] hydrolase
MVDGFGLPFDLVEVDDAARLFISPHIEDWALLEAPGIRVVFDLDGGLDHGVPTLPGHTLYIYFPIHDGEVPDRDRLHALAVMGAALVRAGQAVLSHCGAGYNRSALLAGLILVELGWSGAAALERLRERRPGALFNEEFAAYVAAQR